MSSRVSSRLLRGYERGALAPSRLQVFKKQLLYVHAGTLNYGALWEIGTGDHKKPQCHASGPTMDSKLEMLV